LPAIEEVVAARAVVLIDEKENLMQKQQKKA
jgi:hypothetical protein